MKNITIGFSTGHTLFARLIRMFEGNVPYSHVFIKFHSDTFERDIIYQASGLQVNFIGAILFATKVKIIKEFKLEVNDQAYKRIMQFAIDNAGTPYGYKQLLGMGIVRIAKLFNKTIKNPFSDGKATYVCSELAGTVLQSFIIKHDIPLNLETSGPKDLYKFLEKLNKNNIL